MKGLPLKICCLLLMLISFTGCKIRISQVNQLEGQWVWNSSICCGNDALLYRSDSNHLNIQLNFKKYTIDYIANGTYSKSEIYHIRKGLNDFQYESGDTLSVIEFGQSAAAYFKLQNDTLTITRSYIEGSIDIYVRKK